ncbi:unnamed protein product [Brachionus calyciflorus]|uniref:ATP-dependent DNA helicase PIF1 n=1 Tax=Brachionus calyciflorus TaxID=104777 RepID=A0A814LJU9_9BILA|nr:unnamed protein product [Brachionus calyciflorus]
MDLLPRCRNGQNTLEDWLLLLENAFDSNNIKNFNEATMLFIQNEKVNQHNNKKLIELQMPIINILAKNSSKKVQRLDSDQAMGLSNSIYTCINSKITLTNNLWTSRGLVNSANGIIRDIIVPIGYTRGDLPETLIIEVEDYDGPQFFDDLDKHNYIPINPISIFAKQASGTRTQLPIRLGYAMTIHKSQGQTLKKAVIDLGNSEISLGLTFVALSRLKNINDFLIVAFPFDRLTKIRKSTCLQPRLDEEERLIQLKNKTLHIYRNFLPE